MYIKFLAQGGNPWTVDYLMVVMAMQKIWNMVYGKMIPYKISSDGPVFAIVSL